MNRMNRSIELVTMWIALIYVALVSGAARAATPSHQGLWRGTIGNADVVVLLGPKNCPSSYYYVKHLWSIPLTEQPEQTWEEPASSTGTAAWKLEQATGDNLSGQWTPFTNSSEGKPGLPIRLKRIAGGTGAASECAAALRTQYDAIRVAAHKILTKPARFENYPYRTLTTSGGDIKGMEIPASQQRLPRLNHLLRKWQQQNTANIYGCAEGFGDRLALNNPQVWFRAELKPVFWNARLLVLEENFDTYCGGAHPSGGIGSYWIWDLNKDKAIEPWEWIRDSKGQYGYVASEKLRQLILSFYPRKWEEACAGSIKMTDSYLIYPGKAGMVFSPRLPHAARACGDDTEVPYAKLRPHLTPQGAATLTWLLHGKHK